ncbi:MAG TPA: hypothetical protein ENI70_00945, partial [Candidatus Peregrinibacteria bacterium]|nr:hypothetical protein [Candidatus Peregrinibacteria bacterium]
MNKTELWQNVLSRLSEIVPRADFITWFKNTAVIDAAEDYLTIGTHLPIAAKWISEKFEKEVLKAIQEFNPQIKKIKVELDPNLSKNDPRTVDINQFQKEKKYRKRRRLPEIVTSEGVTSKILDQKYSLDNFIVGPDNRLAHAACCAVAAAPGEKYNPLFVYSNVGLGKTHLLQGTANEILKRDSNKLVAYVTSETFCNEYIRSLKTRRVE